MAKNLSITDYRIYLGTLLANEQVRGDIILLSIADEGNLDDFLAHFFVPEGRRFSFQE